MDVYTVSGGGGAGGGGDMIAGVDLDGGGAGGGYAVNVG